jgi:NAD(P)-dependent dehydrogenase (short-subunit alcohol dehydrogenase family)
MATQKTLQSPSLNGGSVVLVTGAGGALGSALCAELLALGQRVIGLVRPSESPGVLQGREDAWALEADIGQPRDWERALSEAEARWGHISCAALCAGGWEGGKQVHETEPEVWQRVFQSNLTTAQLGIAALCAHMRRHGGGSIVVIGSRAVERPWESTQAAAYAASKAALVSVIKTAAQELLDQGVRLNAVLPSTLDTPANRRAMPQANFSRWATLAEVNHVITFLLSAAASGVTGAAIPVYGRL